MARGSVLVTATVNCGVLVGSAAHCAGAVGVMLPLNGGGPSSATGTATCVLIGGTLTVALGGRLTEKPACTPSAGMVAIVGNGLRVAHQMMGGTGAYTSARAN